MASSTLVSPYADELKRIADQHAGKTDTVRRQAQVEYLQEQIKQFGPTLKPMRFNGQTYTQYVHQFVTFEDIDCHYASSELQQNKLPSLADFQKMLSIVSHLNDKTTDLDKICMPRQSRLDAIKAELLNTSEESTDPPPGYAGDRTAGWRHEVKKQWSINAASEPQKNGEGPAISLERAYRIITRAHIQGEDEYGRKIPIKHLGRDQTWNKLKIITETPDNTKAAFHSQIVKDFVAACPACCKSAKRKSRMGGVDTTRAKEGNGKKSPESKSKKRSQTESNVDGNGDYSDKRAAKKSRKSITTSPQVPVNNNPIASPCTGIVHPKQLGHHMDLAQTGAQFNQPILKSHHAQAFGNSFAEQHDMSEVNGTQFAEPACTGYSAQQVGTVNPSLNYGQQSQADDYDLLHLAEFNAAHSHPVDLSCSFKVSGTTQTQNNSDHPLFKNLSEAFRHAQLQHEQVAQAQQEHAASVQFDPTSGYRGFDSLDQSSNEPLPDFLLDCQQSGINQQPNNPGFTNVLTFGDAAEQQLPQQETMASTASSSQPEPQNNRQQLPDFDTSMLYSDIFAENIDLYDFLSLSAFEGTPQLSNDAQVNPSSADSLFGDSNTIEQELGPVETSESDSNNSKMLQQNSTTTTTTATLRYAFGQDEDGKMCTISSNCSKTRLTTVGSLTLPIILQQFQSDASKEQSLPIEISEIPDLEADIWAEFEKNGI